MRSTWRLGSRARNIDIPFVAMARMIGRLLHCWRSLRKIGGDIGNKMNEVFAKNLLSLCFAQGHATMPYSIPQQLLEVNISTNYGRRLQLYARHNTDACCHLFMHHYCCLLVNVLYL